MQKYPTKKPNKNTHHEKEFYNCQATPIDGTNFLVLAITSLLSCLSFCSYELYLPGMATAVARRLGSCVSLSLAKFIDDKTLIISKASLTKWGSSV